MSVVKLFFFIGGTSAISDFARVVMTNPKAKIFKVKKNASGLWSEISPTNAITLSVG